jgi:hypothetical protein
MRQARLTRFLTNKYGTFGVLLLDDDQYCWTLEPEERDNMSSSEVDGGSAIPTGQYDVVRRYSPKYKRDTYHVTDVARRSFILIHPGNNEDASLGCILLGQRSGEYKGKQAILESRKAVDMLEKAFNNEPFRLTIVDKY